MSSAYGSITRPEFEASRLSRILPIHSQLKDGTHSRLYHLTNRTNGTFLTGKSILAEKYPNLVNLLHTLFNQEILDGNTYPQEKLLSRSEFEQYFLAYDCFLLLREEMDEGIGLMEREWEREQEKEEKERDVVVDVGVDLVNWESQVLGMFYVKPNFPGRCSHICNGGFFVRPSFRNLGVGRCMAEGYLKVAPELGYLASMFNLVFVNNLPSIQLWRRLGFKEIGRIPKAARLLGNPGELVDAIIFYYDFTQTSATS